jgi:maleylpyruvate isomerase
MWEKQESTNLVLYHYWRSSASYRVRLGLALKGVPHQKRHINLLTQEEKSPQYVAVNPSGYLPALVSGTDRPMGESLAILEWLEEVFPEPSFFFGGPRERALVRQVAETINSGIQPLHNLDVLRAVTEDKEAQSAWTRRWIEKGLGVVEAIAREFGSRDGSFLFGAQPTLADLCLIPQMYTAKRFQLDLSPYPRCLLAYERAALDPVLSAEAPERYQPKDS